MKVNMIPGIEHAINSPDGISRVIEAYYKYGTSFGIEFVDHDEDIKAVHAGMTGRDCDVAILHGLYFTGDYPATASEYATNQAIVEAVRSARAITVPTEWVSEIIKRDMRVTPFVVPHGIEADLWRHDYPNEGYVLYNKNRDGFDVCNSIHLDKLAIAAPDVKFVSTFTRMNPSNVVVTGVMPHDRMKPVVQRSMVYLSVTKETFGIGVLEAMASGVPVLGWRYGGNRDIIQHGVTGYLAVPNDYNDLLTGLRYCIDNRNVLSANSIEYVKRFTWENSVSKLKEVFEYALEKKNESPTVSIVIPAYNYAKKIENAISSCVDQTKQPENVIVVDDGSTDNLEDVFEKIALDNDNGYTKIQYLKKENGGVATARNFGAKNTDTKYICFLDADDMIDPEFIETCVNALEKDNSLYIAYTPITWVDDQGRTGISKWPGDYSFDAQMSRKNQIPTCCVMRREVFDRLGGQRQRFAPYGAGAEDAEFWTRAGTFGMKGAKVTDKPLFIYSIGSGNTSKPGYRETDWLGWFGWQYNGVHPFASLATPSKRSHPVFQYDEPLVSVIIPVGKKHEKYLVDSLDSLDRQSFRKWEAIVVLDSKDIEFDYKAYPHVKVFRTEKDGSGPGVARNIGVKNAHGYFILFLDADDWLEPMCIEKMLSQWRFQESIIYSDYFGIATVNQEDLSQFGQRLIDYDERLKRAMILHKSTPYQCERAQLQPDKDIYHWCIITCLIPKEWHDEIGGFDESMESWEDVDYHWRMSHLGKCYTRIEEPLITYRFDTGFRRNLANAENSGQTAIKLLQYMKDKYEGVTMSPCAKCPGGATPSNPSPELSELLQKSSSAQMVSAVSSMSDTDFVEILYDHPNRGDHPVYGPISRVFYGYRSGGDRFLIELRDQKSMPDIFKVADASAVQAPTPKPAFTSPAKPIGEFAVQQVQQVVEQTKEEDTEELDTVIDYIGELEIIPGVTHNIAESLFALGAKSLDDILKLDDEVLLAVKGLGETRIKMIRKYGEDQDNVDD